MSARARPENSPVRGALTALSRFSVAQALTAAVEARDEAIARETTARDVAERALTERRLEGAETAELRRQLASALAHARELRDDRAGMAKLLEERTRELEIARAELAMAEGSLTRVEREKWLLSSVVAQMDRVVYGKTSTGGSPPKPEEPPARKPTVALNRRLHVQPHTSARGPGPSPYALRTPWKK